MRLRDGDTFWYQRIYSGRQLNDLEGTRLSDIIARNSDINNLQNNVFFFEVRIQGTVFNDSNGNGTQDRRESGLSGVRVELLDEAGALLASTTTAADGSYRFANINEPGTFTVHVVPPAGKVATTANPQDVTATRGQTLRANFGFRQGTTAATGSSLEPVAVDMAFVANSLQDDMAAVLGGGVA